RGGPFGRPCSGLDEVVKSLSLDRSIDFIYTDHDIQDTRGQRMSPLFKPRLVSRSAALDELRHALLRVSSGVGRTGRGIPNRDGGQSGLRPDPPSDGADGPAAHIPKPQYSWVQAPGSVAANRRAKPYAHEHGRRALQDALARRGIAGEVLDGYGAPYRYRVKRDIIGRPTVSIVLPTRDNW